MQKILLFCLATVFIFFQYQFYRGHGGNIDNQKVKSKIAYQLQLNKQWEERNTAMMLQVENLNGSLDALEERARYELNLIKPNEILVVLSGSDVTVKK